MTVTYTVRIVRSSDDGDPHRASNSEPFMRAVEWDCVDAVSALLATPPKPKRARKSRAVPSNA